MVLASMVPAGIAGAYGESPYYGYGQSTYYAQPSYVTIFTENVTASQSFAVTGSISKGSGTFVIDHPLDPKNKLLYHSFVESPDAKNMYDGVVRLDAEGEATVVLPAYFEELNTEYRYLVTPNSAPMPNLFIRTEVHNNSFGIGGGVPGEEVSWQITGIRKDPYILANPIIPEVQKSPDALVDVGEYLFEGAERKTIFSRVKGWLSQIFVDPEAKVE